MPTDHLTQPEPPTPPRPAFRPYLHARLAWAVGLLGMLVTGLLTWQAHGWRQEMVQLALERDAGTQMALMASVLNQGQEKVRTLGDFADSQPALNRSGFRGFMQPSLRRHEVINAASLVLRVPHAQRPQVEAQLSRAWGRPLRFKQLDSQGRMTLAQERTVYYPVVLIEAEQPMPNLVGLDLSSEKIRQRAMTRAAASGDLAATAPLQLAATPDGPGFVLVRPLYREADASAPFEGDRRELRGFVTAGFFMHDLMTAALPPPGRRPPLNIAVYDRTDPDAPEQLWRREQQVAPHFRVVHDLELAGRQWRAVFTPTPAYVAGVAGVEPAAVLVVGTIFSALITLTLLSLIHNNRQIASFAVERSRINAELRQLNQEMEQFMSSVSHDLKTPLVTADLMVSSIQRAIRKDQPQDAAEAAEHIRKSCQHMRRIIDDLIDHSRAGFRALQIEELDLTQLVMQALEEHQEALSRHHVRVHVAEDLPVIRADPGRMRSVLDNLIGNAVKYGAMDGQPTLQIGWETDEQELRLFVRDNGPGIPPEHREAIFDLFHRLRSDEDDDGTGIGLATVQRAAQAHGGRAWVDDTPGGGATFWLSLPLSTLVRESSEASDPAS